VDFARVRSHLDKQPQRVTYFNLPKLREMVSSSAMLQGLIGASPEVQQMVEMFLSEEFMGVGLGSSSIKIDGGIRTTTFGPEALSGGAAMLGVVAATAVPNLLNAIDRGKQKRTMADIRSAATACEAYAIDNDQHPSTESTWVPLSEIDAALSPAYIRELPGTDGWDHPLMYWSDGEHYRVASPGKDGEMSQDWSGETEAGPTTEFSADIVFADGSFVVWPEGRQE
jgi:general secretion pathway protein G